MKSGAFDALLSEVRTSELDFYHRTDVERLMEKAFVAGKQVAFSAALHECDAYINARRIYTREGGAALDVAQAIELRAEQEKKL